MIDFVEPVGEGRNPRLQVDTEMAGSRKLFSEHCDLVGFLCAYRTGRDFRIRLPPLFPPVPHRGADHHEDQEEEDQVRKVRHHKVETARLGVLDS